MFKNYRVKRLHLKIAKAIVRLRELSTAKYDCVYAQAEALRQIEITNDKILSMKFKLRNLENSAKTTMSDLLFRWLCLWILVAIVIASFAV